MRHPGGRPLPHLKQPVIPGQPLHISRYRRQARQSVEPHRRRLRPRCRRSDQRGPQHGTRRVQQRLRRRNRTRLPKHWSRKTGVLTEPFDQDIQRPRGDHPPRRVDHQPCAITLRRQATTLRLLDMKTGRDGAPPPYPRLGDVEPITKIRNQHEPSAYAPNTTRPRNRGQADEAPPATPHAPKPPTTIFSRPQTLFFRRRPPDSPSLFADTLTPFFSFRRQPSHRTPQPITQSDTHQYNQLTPPQLNSTDTTPHNQTPAQHTNTTKSTKRNPTTELN